MIFNKTFLNSIIINFASLLQIVFLYLFEKQDFFYIPIILSMLNFYYLFFKDLFKNNILYISKLFITFLFTYAFFGALIFNISNFFELLVNFLNLDSFYFDVHNLFLYNMIIIISVIPANYLLSKQFKSNILENKSSHNLYTSLGQLTEILLVLYILFISYLFYKTGGKYIWFSNLESKEELFTRMSWISVLLSGLIPYSYKNTSIRQTKMFYIYIIIIVLFFGFLKIRMYSALFIFLFLINLNLRGFVFKKNHFLYILFFIFILLVSNIFRFSSFSFEQTYIVLFTILGEFIMPNISTFYLINNPLHFDSLFAIQDLYFQMLPSSVRPPAELYAFRDYYISKSLHPWPIGGIYFLGQFYFYFGIFYIFILIGLIKYLIEIQNILNTKRFSFLLLSFPMFVMILPRMELWTLKSSLFSIVFFILVLFLIKIISTKRNKFHANSLR